MNYKYELSKALFYNDYERVKSLIESEAFMPKLLIDSGDFADIEVPTPIYFISQLWNEILPGNWGFVQEAVDKTLIQLNLINEYFLEQFNVSLQFPANLEKYYKYICNDDYLCSDDDIMCEPIEALIAKGFRKIDIDLYCAVKRADRERVENLLKMGANDSVCFEDEDDSTYNYLCDDFGERDIWQTKTLYPNPNYDARKFSILDVHCMISSAWKYRMIALLNKYYKRMI